MRVALVARSPRSRARSSNQCIGFAKRYVTGGVIVNDHNFNRIVETCDDTIGPITSGGPLTLKRSVNMFPAGSGSISDPEREMVNFVPELLQYTVGHLYLPALPNLSTKLLAVSNPSRPVVDLPLFIFELKDLPKMAKGLSKLPSIIKSAGDAILGGRTGSTKRDAAGQYLSWEFGWKPLFSDLSKLADFQASVDKKMLELQKIASPEGSRRKYQLGENTASSQETNIILNSSPSGFLFRGDRKTVTRRRSWGVITIKATTPLPADPRDLRKLAFRTALGLNASASTVWNALPWSWLADWFGNVGEFLDAHRNTIPSVSSDGWVMTQTDTEVDVTVRFPSWGGGTQSGKGTAVTKVRSASTGAYVSFGVPFLSGRQLAILGALAVSRRGRNPK